MKYKLKISYAKISPNLFNFILLQLQMGKGIKKKEIVNNHHHLIIQPRGGAYLNQKVLVDFTPQVRESQLSNLRRMDQNIPKSILPTFNNDKLYFTPCFHIPALEYDVEVYLQKHISKLQKFQQIDEPEILVPKPRNRFYCHVCQITFQDYAEHIQSQKHFQNQKNNKFHHKIVKLCKKICKMNIQKGTISQQKGWFADQSQQQPVQKTKKIQHTKDTKKQNKKTR